MDLVGELSRQSSIVDAVGSRVDSSTIQDVDFEIAKVIGGPFALNEEGCVDLGTKPLLALHPIESIKNV